MTPHPPQDATDANLGDDGGDLWQQAEWLCRAVAGRDLAGKPLYIVSQSRMPDLGFASDLHGVTSPTMDLFVREYVDAYQGRGPAMVINDAEIREYHHPGDVEYIFFSVVLHELAHILERPQLHSDRPVDDDPQHIKYDALVIADATNRPPPVGVPAYHGHDHVFIRVCLHLAHRAEKAGVAVHPNVFCGGRSYGLFPATAYQDALGDEPSELSDLKFQDILAIDPPAAFTKLWLDDVERHHQLYLPSKGVQT